MPTAFNFYIFLLVLGSYNNMNYYLLVICLSGFHITLCAQIHYEPFIFLLFSSILPSHFFPILHVFHCEIIQCLQCPPLCLGEKVYILITGLNSMCSYILSLHFLVMFFQISFIHLLFFHYFYQKSIKILIFTKYFSHNTQVPF